MTTAARPIIVSKMINRYPLKEFEDITQVKPLTGVYINPTNWTHDQIKQRLCDETAVSLWNLFSEANPELAEAFPNPSCKEIQYIIDGVISEFPIVDIQHFLIKISKNELIPQDVVNYTPLERLIQYVATWRLSPTQLNYLREQLLKH